MKAANRDFTEQVVLSALEALVLARSSPQLERYYSLLLFQRANGQPIDVSAFGELNDVLDDASAQEFLRLVQLL